MYWNLRFVRTQTDEPEIEETTTLVELREVYYDEDKKPMGHAAPCLLGEVGENWPGVLARRVRIAAREPILEGSDFTRLQEDSDG